MHYAPGTPISLEATSPRREQETLTLTFQGPPSVPVWMGLSNWAQPLFLMNVKGSLLLEPPLAILPMGTTSIGGTLTRSYPVQNMAVGIEGAVYYTQSCYWDPAVGFKLGSGSSVLLLDGGF